jgi:hypothetical protein
MGYNCIRTKQEHLAQKSRMLASAVEGPFRMGWHKRKSITSSETANPATLADMVYESLSIFCWCNRCSHNAAVDPAPLIKMLGPLFPVPELGRYMRCSICQERDITTRPAWPPYGGGQIARHHC